MKHSKKLTSTTLLATALVLSLFATQSVMAGEEGPQDEYAGHAHPDSFAGTPMNNCTKTKDGRVNYSLTNSEIEEETNHYGMFPDPEH